MNRETQESSTEQEVQYRYPGTRPFREFEEELFFGRHYEIEEILYSIKSNGVNLLHGISGIGKSSLINAGILPRLREVGFFPILVRFGEQKNEVSSEAVNPLARIITAVKFSLQVFEKNVLPSHLWFCCKLLNYFGQKPVLIFDQFEEFFYAGDEEVAEAIKEIAQLISLALPSDIEEGLLDDQMRQFPKPQNPLIFNWHSPLQIKLLFSVRSDRLEKLESFSPQVPSLLTNRYQLKGLSDELAQQAIILPTMISPSKGMKFNSNPFQFDKLLVDAILKTVNTTNKGIAETTQMQMICKEIEELVIEKQRKQSDYSVVTKKELGDEQGIKKLIDNYYKNQLQKIQQDKNISEQEFLAVRKLIEKEMLVDRKRILLDRYSLSANLKEEGVSDNKIEYIKNLLLKHRLLQLQNWDNNIFYEIAHDSLVEAIQKERRERERIDKERQEKEVLNEIQSEIDRKNSLIEEIRKAQEKTSIVLQEKEAVYIELKSAYDKIKLLRNSAFIFFAVIFILSMIAFFYANKFKNISEKNLSEQYIAEALNAYGNNEHGIAFRKLLASKSDSAKELIDSLDFFEITADKLIPSSQGDKVVAIYNNSTAVVWKLNGIATPTKMLVIADISNAKFSPSGNFLAYIDKTENLLNILAFSNKRDFEVIDLQSGKPFYRDTGVIDAKFHPSRPFFSFATNRSLYVRNYQTGARKVFPIKASENDYISPMYKGNKLYFLGYTPHTTNYLPMFNIEVSTIVPFELPTWFNTNSNNSIFIAEHSEIIGAHVRAGYRFFDLVSGNEKTFSTNSLETVPEQIELKNGNILFFDGISALFEINKSDLTSRKYEAKIKGGSLSLIKGDSTLAFVSDSSDLILFNRNTGRSDTLLKNVESVEGSVGAYLQVTVVRKSKDSESDSKSLQALITLQKRNKKDKVAYFNHYYLP